MRSLLEILSAEGKFIIAGDINIHMDDTSDSLTKQFNTLLEEFNLIQIINKPTHKAGHTLDILIVQKSEVYVEVLEIRDICISDHFLVTFSLQLSLHQKKEKKFISFRNTKNCTSLNFKTELDQCLSSIQERNSVANFTSSYKSKLKLLMDKHCPVITKEIKHVPESPWFDNEYKLLRQKRRYLEKKFHRTLSEHDKIAFKDARKMTTLLAKKKKSVYYTEKISQAIDQQKCLFSVIAELTDTKKQYCLPSSVSDEILANDFSKFFIQKIHKIRESFTANTPLQVSFSPCNT